jgi:hypothetical protein
MSDEIAPPEQELSRRPWLMRLALGAGALLLVGFFFLWLGYLYLLHVVSRYQEMGNLFAYKTGYAIVMTHSEQEMLNVILPLSGPDFRENTKKQKFDEIYATYERLGKFESYGGIKGSGKMTFQYKQGFHTVGVYHATAVFEHGDLDMTLTIQHEHFDWQIVGLYYGVKLF